MITDFTGNETALELTADLRERLNNNIPYERDVSRLILPFEPYVKVTEIKELSNHRAFEIEGFFIIPIATYTDGCRENYTLFDEVLEWSEMYGVENIFVDVISNLMPEIIY